MEEPQRNAKRRVFLRSIQLRSHTPTIPGVPSTSQMDGATQTDLFGQPVTRNRRALAEVRPCGVLSHHLTPSLLLGYTKSLLGRCPEAFQVSIGGRSFGYSESLSAEVEAGYPELIARITSTILVPPTLVFIRTMEGCSETTRPMI